MPEEDGLKLLSVSSHAHSLKEAAAAVALATDDTYIQLPLHLVAW